MSDNWTMPDELRAYIDSSSAAPRPGGLRVHLRNAIEHATDYYRTAGLLLTPGERDRQVEAGVEALQDIRRLRAENERLKKLLDELRRWCGCGYAEDGLFNRIDTALGAEHE